jgi:hypothetical protein
MYRRFELIAFGFAAVVFGLVAAQPLRAQDGAAVRITGDAAALQLDVHQATVADVLTALARFNIRYRSPSALNAMVDDGTYAGPLSRVLSRLLAGYNYAIKQGDAEIDVIIISRHGEQAIPAPIIVRRRGSGE